MNAINDITCRNERNGMNVENEGEEEFDGQIDDEAWEQFARDNAHQY